MIREKIIETMRSKGVTQKEIAGKCDISVSNLNHYLRGRRNLPVEKIEQILSYLSIGLKNLVP